MGPLDRWLPQFDVREYHEHAVGVDAPHTLRALLETPAACDRVTRLLFALRGLGGGHAPLGRLFEEMGFTILERTDSALVLGATGQPWRPRGSLGPFYEDRPGTVRIVADLRARPRAISTETRVRAHDERARRAFRCYWLVVGPFSGLIRRRWLAAAARAIASANSSVAARPSDR
jgi:hypothetical protein